MEVRAIGYVAKIIAVRWVLPLCRNRKARCGYPISSEIGQAKIVLFVV